MLAMDCPWARHLISTSSSCSRTLTSLWNVWRKENFPKGINEVSHCYYLITHSLNTMKLQDSLRDSGKHVRGRSAAPQPSPSGLLSYQYFNLLMCNWTDCNCSPQWLKSSGKPSVPVSPHSSTYVAIDQAPVSACHICAQTSVVLIWPTVTYDHASGGWCRWWMKESILCVTFSLFQTSDEQCGELLLNYSISAACPVVENTLLWLNKGGGASHTFPTLASFPTLSSSCTRLCHSFHVLFSLALTSIKWKPGLGSSELAQHHFAVLTRTQERRAQGETFTYSVCSKRDGLLAFAPFDCNPI